MPKEERQIKEITDNDLDTGRDLITENYELEILTLKDKVDLRRFSRSFLKVDKLLKSIFTGKEDKFPKNSGFNREKTDLAENDTNKVFSAKGAFDLKTSLENLITNLKNTLTTHVGSLVSTTQSGHMSKEDKVKLNGIANNANNYIHPTTSGNKHIPTGGGTNYFVKWASDGTGTWGLIDWSFIQNRPSTFPPSSHTHDDRYFTEGEINEKFKNFCPIVIGALIFLDSTANPHTLYPGTTWSKIENRFLYAASTPGTTGGRSSVSLALANVPSHNHPASQVAHNHTANHNHSASQSAHLHSGVSYNALNQFQTVTNEGSADVGVRTLPNTGWSTWGWTGQWGSNKFGLRFTKATFTSGNTGSAQPSITVNTTNVTTSSVTPSITIGNTGSGTAFDIMPPYYTVCVWKRLS